MGASHSRTCHIIVGGIERAVEVDFTIDSYGSPANWDDDGDPPEITIERVMSGDRDITQFCSEMLDIFGQGPGLVFYHGGPLQGLEPYCISIYNGNCSLLEACEEQIYENFHEYEAADDYYD